MERLYASRTPQEVHEHQHVLQQWQRSLHGEEMAEYLLLHTAAPNTQYFGALTYTVVLQAGLDSGAVERVLQIHLQVLARQPPLLVLRKLMLNIALAYLKWPAVAGCPVTLYTHTVLLGRPCELPAPSQPWLPEFVASLLATHLQHVLLFMDVLVQDLARTSSYASPEHVHVREVVFPTVVRVYERLLLGYRAGHLPGPVDAQALATLAAWMAYVPNVAGDARYDDIQVWVEFLLAHFGHGASGDASQTSAPAPAGLGDVLRIFTELLETNPGLVTHTHKQQLYACVFDGWGRRFAQQVVLTPARHEHAELVAAYIELVLAALLLNAVRLARGLLLPPVRATLQLVLALTQIDGVPVEDEAVSERLLTFWEELANVYVDLADADALVLDGEEAAAFDAEKASVFAAVAHTYWRKLHVPPDLPEYAAEWRAYRQTAADFFLAAFSLLKADFYGQIADSLAALAHAETRTLLPDIELSMFVLAKINDDMYFESQAAVLVPHMATVYGLGLLAIMGGLDPAAAQHRAALETFVSFVLLSVFFLKAPAGQAHLRPALHAVFPLVAGADAALALQASNAVARICEDCSAHLLPVLPDLERVVVLMLRNVACDNLVRLRMFNACSVVALAIATENVKQHSAVLAAMVSGISHAMADSMAAAPADPDQLEDYLVSLLLCVVNIAKGSALLDDTLDDMLPETQDSYRRFWLEDPDAVKTMVGQILARCSLDHPDLARKTIVVEKCTAVVKTGLGERLGGPFDLGDDHTVHYIVSLMERQLGSGGNANAVPFVFNLVEAWIAARYKDVSPEVTTQFLQKVFVEKIELLKADPDMIKLAIEVFTKVLEVRPELVIYHDMFARHVVHFAVLGLEANELFTIKSVLKFWAAFLNLKRGLAADIAYVTSLLIDHNVGQSLTQSLVWSFVKASRSNLEYYYTVFRSLVAKHPLPFKQWLQQSLASQDFSGRMDDKALELFVHKLMVTRGRRTANDALKSFWLNANGLVEYNTQNI